MDISVIIDRLKSLGYELDEEKDGWVVTFLIDKVINTIRNECNVSVIPDGLMQVAVDMVCGEFLKGKKASGQLSGFEVDLNSATLKQTSSGDTSVTFAVDGLQSNEQRLDYLIEHLMNYGRAQFITYRRLKWT